MPQRHEKEPPRLGVAQDTVALDGYLAGGTSFHNGLTVPPKRLLGAYYTPDKLAAILVRWAIIRIRGRILDPSFGGCAFLAAATQALAMKGAKDPGRLVFGVDIDASCVDHVRSNNGLVEKNCIIADFLNIAPKNLPGTPFNAIVGNPPYVRHHWLDALKRKAARSVVKKSGVDVSARASTWAYFLIHALSFLEKGGRLAMLVPEAILQADYAVPIRKALADRFRDVQLIHIRDRLFEGSEEPVVAVAASGYGRPGKISIESVERAEELEALLNGSNKYRRRSPHTTVSNGRTVSSATLDLLKRLEEHESVRRIANIATVRIGFVTGANNHFIRSGKNLNRLGIPNEARLPVVARTRWLSGLQFTEEDHQALEASDRRAFLVRPTPKFDDHVGIQRWIEEGEKLGINDRYKCVHRLHWFRVDLPPPPDAFATCTRLGSPLLILNRTCYRSTNALHTLHWSGKPTASPEAVAIGFLTSVVSVWAELHGRRYGGGVLKTEPGTLRQAPVPIVRVPADSFAEIDSLLRHGQEDAARRAADRLVLGQGLGLDEGDIRRLQLAQRELLSQRLPVRREGWK